MFTFRRLRESPSSLAALFAAGIFLLALQASATEAARKSFASAEEAAGALVEAAKANNDRELLAILGPSLKEWIESGDPVADKQAKERFVSDYEHKHSMETNEPNTATLVIGDDDFPFPILLVRSDNKWSFDPELGKQEIIDRRVGENELDTIQTLLAIADAQDDYAELNPAGNGAPGYARRFISSAGKKDGLYWPTTDSEQQSPLGELAAEAAVAGYRPTGEGGDSSRNPFHGYYFKMLARQGSHAPGGAYSYLVNGRMIGGFAVIAWPAKYGASGYKTFMINQDQQVYEADLGPSTATRVQEIETFDPDEDWKKVDDAPQDKD